MTKQLNIDFKPSVYAQYGSLREFIAEHVIPEICKNKKILKKSIAADLDYSPSHFSQKLYSTGDSRLTVDDMEKLVRLYGDLECIRYMVSTFMYREVPNEEELLEARLAEIRLAKKEAS